MVQFKKKGAKKKANEENNQGIEMKGFWFDDMVFIVLLLTLNSMEKKRERESEREGFGVED